MPNEVHNITRAWDAVVITDFLAGTDRGSKFDLREIVGEASENRTKILVSRLATAEVAYFGISREHDEVEPHVVAFFSSNVILVADVTDAITG